jgi:hypothetical protein
MPAGDSTDRVRFNTLVKGRTASIARELKDRLGVSYKALLVMALEVLHERTVESDIRAAQAMTLKQEHQQRDDE